MMFDKRELLVGCTKENDDSTSSRWPRASLDKDAYDSLLSATLDRPFRELTIRKTRVTAAAGCARYNELRIDGNAATLVGMIIKNAFR